MITCSKAREMIDSYIDGDISEADMTAFEDHISTCDDCRELYEFTMQMTSALKRGVRQPPADFTARVMERVRLEAAAPVKQSKITPFFRNWKMYGSAAAAVLLLAVIGKTAVYDRYLEVVRPPADTAYVNNAPEISNVQDGQAANQQEPSTEMKNTSHPTAAGRETRTQNGTVQSQQTAEQKDVLPVEEEAVPDIQLADGREPLQTAAEQQSLVDMAVPAGVPEAQMQEPEADNGQPPVKNSMAEDMAESAADIVEGRAKKASTESVNVDEMPQAFSAAPLSSDMPDSSVDSTAGGSSGGGSRASGGGGSAMVSSAAIAVPKVCHVTIRKSGEGNLLAVQRRLSAVIDGEIDSRDDRLVVTVDAADFAATLAEIQATGFVEKTQTTDSTDGKTVFYIQ